jgi:hypothetical protein
MNGAKEISEAMSVIGAIRSKTLSEPMHYYLLDVCSGNALVPIIATHLLPVVAARAVDTKKRKGHYDKVKWFHYYEMPFQTCAAFWPTILTAVHPCGNLAYDVVDLARTYDSIEMVVIVPCCVAEPRIPVSNKIPWLSKYQKFCVDIASYLHWGDFDVSIKQDDRIMTPANVLIIGERRPLP